MFRKEELDINQVMTRKTSIGFNSRILGLGDYHTLSGAKEEVWVKCCSSKADKLITTLEIINKNKSHAIHKIKAILDAAVKAAKDSGDMEAHKIAQANATIFCNSLRELNALNINPVCISRDDKILYMTNLLKSYLEINGISLEDMKAGLQLPVPIFYLDLDI